jgi:hypothetical protein
MKRLKHVHFTVVNMKVDCGGSNDKIKHIRHFLAGPNLGSVTSDRDGID